MRLYIAYITIVLSLFAYTGVLNTLRDVETGVSNDLFYLNLIGNESEEDIKNLLKENEYIHSIWVESGEKNNVSVYLPNGEDISEISELDFSNGGFQNTIIYKDTIILPFVNKGIMGGNNIAVMFPFYL